MKFDLEKSIPILERTPKVLSILLTGLSEDWTHKNTGENTWSVFDVIGHLIHGEKTDWIPRAKIILDPKCNKNFEPFDRFAQFEISKDKTLFQLINEFEILRKENIKILKNLEITPETLILTGIHPEFGKVTLEQLLATWLTHDLNHISQITCIMAKQFKQEAGPWVKYIKALN